ncbi:18214_t:CDS:2, partial [Racocetra persica]
SNILWARPINRKKSRALAWRYLERITMIWKVSIQINETIYNCGDFVIYKESSTRVSRILAIVKENAIIIVELHKIVNYITVTILYNENDINESSSIVIHEILYKYQEHWKLRNIIYSYQHPSEFVALEDLLISIPVYKLYIDLYYDNFGIFCNIYHSLGSVYIQIRNLLFDKRSQLKNHFMLG